MIEQRDLMRTILALQQQQRNVKIAALMKRHPTDFLTSFEPSKSRELSSKDTKLWFTTIETLDLSSPATR